MVKLVKNEIGYAQFWINYMARGTGLTRLTNGVLEQYQGFRKVTILTIYNI